MTDRELLERAARAAGIPVSHTIGDGDIKATWNPLEDDADAFRLMCDLELNVFQSAGKSWAVDPESWDEISETGGDIREATRRAIVRAAAEGEGGER